MTDDRRFRTAVIVLCVIGAAAVLRRLVAFAMGPATGTSELAALDAHFDPKEALTLVHILPSLLLVALVPFQFSTSLRRSRPRLHRYVGRVAMGSGVIVGLSALLLSTSPVGGAVEAAATTFFGGFFLFALGTAWWHIRQGRVTLHREWVTRMTAIALGVATTRPIIAVFFATSRLTGLTPHDFFGPAMWLGFTSTYLAAEAWIRSARAISADRLAWRS